MLAREMTLVRQFPIELRLDDGDGMTVSGVVVPYNRETLIVEPREDGVITYREMFVPGSCERAARAPSRVTLTYNHSESMPDRMGYGVSFEDTEAGLLGTFRLDHSNAAQSRDILTSSHGAFSVGFVSVVPRPLSERAGGLVVRRSVWLRHVAAVPAGAYAEALVGSVREQLPDGEPTAAEEHAEEMRRRQAELFAFVERAAKQQRERYSPSQ